MRGKDPHTDRMYNRTLASAYSVVRHQMIFFALTRSGYDALVEGLGDVPSQLWVNYGVLSPAELAALRSNGKDVTDFTSPISRTNKLEFEDALHTIREHHPGHSLWVEQGP